MIAPFVTTEGSLNPLETLANDLNVYAGRGFPVVTQLQDASVEATGPTPSSAFYGRPVDLNWNGADNYYVANQSNQGALIGRGPSNDVLTAVPFIAAAEVPITAMGGFCTLGGGSPRYKLAIYDSTNDLNGIPYPGTRMAVSVELIPNAGQRNLVTGFSFTPVAGRMYWMVAHTNTWSPATISSIPLGSVAPLLGTNVQTGSVVPVTCIQVAYSYANPGPPATFPAGATRQTFTPPYLFYGYDFPVAVNLLATPRAVQAPTLSQQVFPSYSPTTDGWVVRGARIVAASTKRSGSAGDQPYLLIKARLRNAQGTRDLGVFDSRRGEVTAGVPFPLTGPAPIDQELPVGASIEVATEQFGTSIITLEDVSVSWELARKKT